MTDNAGATDENRALNYLAVRYPAIYATAAEAFGRNSSLTALDVRLSLAFEKLSIAVEDAPFIAVLLAVEGSGPGQRLGFTTNVGDVAVAGTDNELNFKIVDEAPVPYIFMRRGLMAKAARPVYYQLMELAVTHQGRLGLWSGGVFFAFEST